mmetsp:Transcript_32863/g.94321  ORF Transcript_32863/g.94321 Transcript_32863/m.94321 type:complete len:318 (+) Transcript_32863:98-1051(+)
MPKVRARGGTGASSGGGSVDRGTSDEEILKGRRKREAFTLADDALFAVSWGLWALAALWFLCYSPAAPEAPLSHSGLPAEASTGLLFCGIFCASLSRSSPQGSWSMWRVAWHMAWCPAFAVLAVAFWLTSTRGRPAPAVPPTTYSISAAGACALGAVAMILTLPKFQPTSPKASGYFLGRVMALVDGALGLLTASSVVVSGSGVWGEPVGPVAAALTAIPLGMWGVGTLLCCTDAELTAAIPPAMLQYTAMIIRSLLLVGLPAALPAVLMLALHLALYLPFPLKEPDSNPFYNALRRWYRRWTNLLSEPVSGFGDDD